MMRTTGGWLFRTFEGTVKFVLPRTWFLWLPPALVWWALPNAFHEVFGWSTGGDLSLVCNLFGGVMLWLLFLLGMGHGPVHRWHLLAAAIWQVVFVMSPASQQTNRMMSIWNDPRFTGDVFDWLAYSDYRIALAIAAGLITAAIVGFTVWFETMPDGVKPLDDNGRGAEELPAYVLHQRQT